MRILTRTGLRFILVFITSTEPVKFLASLLGKSFVLILTIVQLDITLEFYFFSFYFVYTSACNLVSVFVCVIAMKVTVSVCEDRVKLNYFRSILNQKEPYTDYLENKEKHTK